MTRCPEHHCPICWSMGVAATLVGLTCIHKSMTTEDREKVMNELKLKQALDEPMDL